MNINDIIGQSANLSVTVSATDLITFGTAIAHETFQRAESTLIPMGDLQTLTVKQVCELLQVDASTLHRWKNDGYLIPIKVGCSPRYRMRDIQQLLERKEENGNDE